MPNTSVQRDHVRLMEETKALEVEHDALEHRPKDLKAHRAHRVRLRKQIRLLRKHAERLKRHTDQLRALRDRMPDGE